MSADDWGPEISDAQAARLERANRNLRKQHRAWELAAAMSEAEVANVYGVSSKTVQDWAVQRKLVGIRNGGEWRFPVWQLSPRLLPYLGQLMVLFPGDAVSLSRWMTRSNDNFDGRTPAQELAMNPAHVFAIIETLGAN